MKKTILGVIVTLCMVLGVTSEVYAQDNVSVQDVLDEMEQVEEGTKGEDIREQLEYLTIYEIEDVYNYLKEKTGKTEAEREIMEVTGEIVDRNNEVLGVVEDSKEWEKEKDKEKDKEEERKGSVIGGIMMIVTSIFVFGLAKRDSEGRLSGTSPFYILAIFLVARGLFLLLSGMFPSVFESIDNMLT